MTQLLEGAIYEVNGQRLQASYLVGSWALVVLNADGEFGIKPCGALAAYRLVDGIWREMFVDPIDDAQLVYGSVVDIDLAALVATASQQSSVDLQLDEAFADLMAEIVWEW